MWFRAWKTMVRRVWRVARKVGGVRGQVKLSQEGRMQGMSCRKKTLLATRASKNFQWVLTFRSGRFCGCPCTSCFRHCLGSAGGFWGATAKRQTLRAAQAAVGPGVFWRHIKSGCHHGIICTIITYRLVYYLSNIRDFHCYVGTVMERYSRH